jgi:hypothetical protein
MPLREAFSGSGLRIPAFLSIDVEPDGFQLSRSDPPKWLGYESAIEFSEWLRSELSKRFDQTPKFGWYYRMDLQIAEVYGRPDYIVAKLGEHIDRLRQKGDYFGVHSHPVRWCDERNSWIHDFADASWNMRCTKFALEAYADWCGTPAQRFRGGAGFLVNEIVDIVDQCGVKVDLTLEPVQAWSSPSRVVPSGVDTSPYIGVHTDCLSAPPTAYRPSHHDFRVPTTTRGRDLIMVPMSTYSVTRRQNRLRRILQRARPQQVRQKRRVLHLSEQWPRGASYWDLVTEQIRSMPRPYISVAVRTDAPGSAPVINARKRFDALLQHPLSKRLQFVDPLDIAPALI